MDQTTSSVVLDFLARLAADRAEGREFDVTHYQASFPGFEDAIAAELAAVHEAPAATTTPHSFDRIAHYHLLGPIDRGGQGAVFRAHDERLGRDVALKLLPRISPTGRYLEEIAYREGVLGSRVDHPGICALYDIGTHGPVVYLALQLVAGRSLRTELLDPESAIHDPIVALRFLAMATEAVAAAHACGVVHLDIKPGNIMVTPTHDPVLLDFGLARSTEESDLEQKGFGGTLAYAAPEQRNGADVGPPADVWALGRVMSELIVHPDADLAAIRDCALAEDSTQRYPSAREFAEDLRHRIARQPISLRRGAVVRAKRWAQRNPWPVLVGTLACTTLGIGWITTSWFLGQESELRQTAERRLEMVRDATETLVFDVCHQLAHLQGATLAGRAAIERAVALLDELEAEYGPELAIEARLLYGDALGHPNSTNAGDMAGAAEQYAIAEQRARATLQLGADDSMRHRVHILLGRILDRQGDLAFARLDSEAADSCYREAAVFADGRDVELTRRITTHLAATTARRGDLAAAFDLLPPLDPDDNSAGAARVELLRGELELERRHSADSLIWLARAIRKFDALVDAAPLDKHLYLDLARALALAGRVHAQLGDASSMRTSAARVELILAELRVSDGEDRAIQLAEIAARRDAGIAEFTYGDIPRARELLQDAVERATTFANSRDPASRDVLRASHLALSSALATGGNPLDEALAHAEAAYAMSRELATELPRDWTRALALAEATMAVANTRNSTGRDGRQLAEDAEQLFDALHRQTPKSLVIQVRSARAATVVGLTFLPTREWGKAAQHFARAARKIAEVPQEVDQVREQVGKILLYQGNTAFFTKDLLEAKALLSRSLEHFDAIHTPTVSADLARIVTLTRRGDVGAALGQPEVAAADYRYAAKAAERCLQRVTEHVGARFFAGLAWSQISFDASPDERPYAIARALHHLDTYFLDCDQPDAPNYQLAEELRSHLRAGSR